MENKWDSGDPMARDEIIKALRQFIHQFDGRDVGDYFVEDVLEAAADMLEQDAPGWISVKDRLPEDGTPVIALCRFASYQCGWYRMTEFATHKSNMWHDGTARYWFPLPELPKEEAK